jgi:uncharacterized protein (DUF1015 family)
MLYSDPARTAEQLLFGTEDAEATLPEIEVTDEYGVLHRVWRITDTAKINLLTTSLEDKKLIIADGHHRYETALNYAGERAPEEDEEGGERTSGGLQQPAYPEAAAMMTFVNMDSEGLTILPTHRVVFGLEESWPACFVEAARPFFEIEELRDRAVAAAMARLSAVEGKTAFVAMTGWGWYLLKAKTEPVDAALEALPARQRQLDVVQLHSLLLEKLPGITPEAIENQTHMRYVRDAAEAADKVARGEANVSFLMNPVRLDQLREVAFAGETMPQKSTDFYPKLLSGLAIYALD